jgi:hypothetical protein
MRQQKIEKAPDSGARVHIGHPHGAPTLHKIPDRTVLYERMAGDDDLCGAVGAQPALRYQPVFELAVVGLDRVGGVPFDEVPGRVDEFVENRGRGGGQCLGVRPGGLLRPV